MNKLYKTALVLLIPGGMIFGQQKDYSGYSNELMQKAQVETVQMDKEVHLSPDQFHKVLDINLDYENQMDSFTKLSGTFTDEEKKETLNKINNKYESDLNNVFTIAQSELYKKLGTEK